MKKIWKITALFCVLAAFLCLCSFEGRAEFRVDNQWGDTPLTEADIAGLTALADAQTDNAGDTVFLVVFASDWESTAKEELRANGFSSAKQNVIGLVVWNNGSRYETELYTYGDMSRYITDEEIQTLKSEVDVDAKAGRMAKATRTLIVRSSEMLAAGKAKNPPMATGTKILLSIAIGLAAGIVAGGVAVLVVVLWYRKKNRSASYPLDQFANLKLTLERDTFLYNTVTKTAVSSSSGGRGGGGGGGGRSSGRS